MNKIFYIVVVFFVMFFAGCKEDKKTIIGIWQNEQDWFEFTAKQTYNTGTGPMVAYKDLSYSVDEKNSKLTMYTSDENKTFFMKYTLVHKDTLELKNMMPNAIGVKFYRVAKVPDGFR
jgi:hypothetical protein